MNHFLRRALVLSILGWPWISSPATGEPFRPVDDNQVIESLPTGAGRDARQRELRRLRSELADDADNLDLAVPLARGYIALARAEGDPRFQGYAQAVLAPWWDLPQPPPEVLMLRATIRQNGHDFDSALEDLEHLLTVRPRHPQAWLTRAVILQVQGRHAEAYESCWPLQRSNRLLAAACLAGAASSSGHAEGSYDMLHRALLQAPGARVEDRLWALTGLAEIALRLGRHEDAERHFDAALALGVRDIYLLSAYSDFLLDLDRPQEVRRLLAEETRSDTLLLRLSLAESRLGASELKQHVSMLDDRFSETQRRGDQLHQGAESRFRLELMDQPAEALRLALDNWRVQREPVDARRVLEAALAEGDLEAAAPLITWLSETGLQDVRLDKLVQQLQEAG